MKRNCRILALLLALMLLAFGAAAETAEGDYTMFAISSDGYMVDANEMGASSVITLAADGGGRMTMDAEEMGISSWTLDDDALFVVFEDESSFQATLQDGILILDVWGTGEMLYYYAREGADISGYNLMTVQELQAAYAAKVPNSLLYALWTGLDTGVGVHMNYDLHTDYQDATMHYDSHGKDGVFCSRRDTEVSGYTNTVVTFFRDGIAYNLNPEKKTGLVVTESASSIIGDNIMLLDSLYANIWRYAQETVFTEETRELDGVSCVAEIFPATEYTPEVTFYFDDGGRLIRCEEGAPVIDSGIDIGESIYTVHVIDEAVDESLFDISAYEITK